MKNNQSFPHIFLVSLLLFLISTTVFARPPFIWDASKGAFFVYDQLGRPVYKDFNSNLTELLQSWKFSRHLKENIGPVGSGDVFFNPASLSRYRRSIRNGFFVSNNTGMPFVIYNCLNPQITESIYNELMSRAGVNVIIHKRRTEILIFDPFKSLGLSNIGASSINASNIANRSLGGVMTTLSNYNRKRALFKDLADYLDQAYLKGLRKFFPHLKNNFYFNEISLTSDLKKANNFAYKLSLAVANIKNNSSLESYSSTTTDHGFPSKPYIWNEIYGTFSVYDQTKKLVFKDFNSNFQNILKSWAKSYKAGDVITVPEPAHYLNTTAVSVSNSINNDGAGGRISSGGISSGGTGSDGTGSDGIGSDRKSSRKRVDKIYLVNGFYVYHCLSPEKAVEVARALYDLSHKKDIIYCRRNAVFNLKAQAISGSSKSLKKSTKKIEKLFVKRHKSMQKLVNYLDSKYLKNLHGYFPHLKESFACKKIKAVHGKNEGPLKPGTDSINVTTGSSSLLTNSYRWNDITGCFYVKAGSKAGFKTGSKIVADNGIFRDYNRDVQAILNAWSVSRGIKEKAYSSKPLASDAGNVVQVLNNQNFIIYTCKSPDSALAHYRKLIDTGFAADTLAVRRKCVFQCPSAHTNTYTPASVLRDYKANYRDFLLYFDKHYFNALFKEFPGLRGKIKINSASYDFIKGPFNKKNSLFSSGTTMEYVVKKYDLHGFSVLIPSAFRTEVSKRSNGIDLIFRKSQGTNTKGPENSDKTMEYSENEYSDYEYFVSAYMKNSFNLETMANYYEEARLSNYRQTSSVTVTLSGQSFLKRDYLASNGRLATVYFCQNSKRVFTFGFMNYKSLDEKMSDIIHRMVKEIKIEK